MARRRRRQQIGLVAGCCKTLFFVILSTNIFAYKTIAFKIFIFILLHEKIEQISGIICFYYFYFSFARGKNKISKTCVVFCLLKPGGLFIRHSVAAPPLNLNDTSRPKYIKNEKNRFCWTNTSLFYPDGVFAFMSISYIVVAAARLDVTCCN